ncbi:ferulic acid esterase (FaeA) [Planoprotostelium fungivorum]|uniref:Ferulic acid esterase (FaeA) n=1 Tax=Planoprotostelium fungivorum TaxID=1890364 RepID=A0A2P6N1I1_9EUKA|nr:ferulic acid esterase (FaeA) [Planoprotostelium fungivorum]
MYQLVGLLFLSLALAISADVYNVATVNDISTVWTTATKKGDANIVLQVTAPLSSSTFKAITLNGNKTVSVTLTASSLTSVTNVSLTFASVSGSATVSNISFFGGLTPTTGNILVLNVPTVTINNCAFTNVFVNSPITTTSTTFLITNTLFTGLNTNYGVYLSSQGSYEARNCNFTQNSMKYSAFYTVNGGTTITITDSIFIGNSVTTSINQGVINRKSYRSATIRGCIFSQNNVARLLSGTFSATFSISNCNFTENIALYDIISTQTGSPSLVTVQNANFTSNTAGNIFYLPDTKSQLVLTNAILSDSNVGSTIYTNALSIQLNNVDNTGGYNSFFLNADRSSATAPVGAFVTARNSIFRNADNSVILTRNFDSLNVTGCTFTGATLATGEYPVIAVSAFTVSVTSSQFDTITGPYAVFVTGSYVLGAITLDGNTFSNVQVLNQIYGLTASTSQLSVSNNRFTDVQGAILYSTGNQTLVHANVIVNVTSNGNVFSLSGASLAFYDNQLTEVTTSGCGVSFRGDVAASLIKVDHVAVQGFSGSATVCVAASTSLLQFSDSSVEASTGSALSVTASQVNELNVYNNEFSGISAVSGSAVSVSAQTSTVTVAFFRNNVIQNVAAQNGGALSLAGPVQAVTIGDSIFSFNSASSGGAFYIASQNLVLISNSTITNNNAATGGAFTLSGASLKVYNSLLLGNSAVNGSLVYATAASSVDGNGNVIDTKDITTASGSPLTLSGDFQTTISCPNGNLVTYSNGISCDAYGFVPPTTSSTTASNSATAALTYGCGGNTLPSGYTRGSTTTFVLPAGYAPNQPIRTYTVHVPSDYTFTNTPIVFSFHGATQTSAVEEDISSLSTSGLKINNSPFIAVYPQGVAGTKGTTAWLGAPYSNTSVDDVGFTLQILDILKNDLCVDESRVYATGKSNGGGFTNYLACTPVAAAKFAAFSTVSAAIYTDYTFGLGNLCQINRGIPLMDFHGTADDVIPYNGGFSNNANITASPFFVSEWASRLNCDLTASTLQTIGGGVVNQTTWTTGCRAGAQVVHFKIQDMDHAWPRTTLPNLCNGLAGNNDCDPTVINANDYILPFFTQYPLPSTNSADRFTTN